MRGDVIDSAARVRSILPSDMSVHHDEGAVTQRAVPGPALYFTSSAMPAAMTRPSALVGIVHGLRRPRRALRARDGLLGRARGLGSVSIDLRGHGRATGPRGYVSRFDEYLDDAAELARLVADRAKGAPVFLMGHSMGGLVAALSAIESPRSWRGLILSAPYFGLAMEVPIAKRIAGRIASRLAPRVSLPMGLTGAILTHDPAFARAHDEDPLVFPNADGAPLVPRVRPRPRGGRIARAKSLAAPAVRGVPAPGDRDRASLEAGRVFFDAAGSTDKTFDEREGLARGAERGSTWKDIAGVMAEWMRTHA